MCALTQSSVSFLLPHTIIMRKFTICKPQTIRHASAMGELRSDFRLRDLHGRTDGRTGRKHGSCSYFLAHGRRGSYVRGGGGGRKKITHIRGENANANGAERTRMGKLWRVFSPIVGERPRAADNDPGSFPRLRLSALLIKRKRLPAHDC